MLGGGDCEKTVVISSSNSNQWTLQIENEKNLMGSTRVLMEKQEALLQQQQQPSHQPLRCPRCDSSNTKFCYYNNYSLSQPRHFCKACKRYWTRGGTLRNVPVGGGCRKNKRVKRPNGSNLDGVEAEYSSNPSSNLAQAIDISSNPLLYGFSSHYNNPFSYPQELNGANRGLGLSSSGFDNYPNSKQIHEGLASNSLLSSIYGSSFSNQNLASLIGLTPCAQTLDMSNTVGSMGMMMKPVKMEEHNKYLGSNHGEEMDGSLSDYHPPVYNWHDPTNIGSYVTSLI